MTPQGFCYNRRHASSARVVVGASRVSAAGLDLAREELVFERNGQEVRRATGEAVLGHSANLRRQASKE